MEQQEYCNQKVASEMILVIVYLYNLLGKIYSEV
jgi:hypothetical protein